ncbi:phosphate ABC transporter substrate-binding protein [Clostridium sp. BJN0001]|uniref:phosphate ABC transporter substrate-binding protein n=1 Tax=Clostridium sp. BJN0001 TaxID=2930219 RepID=UPI001FD5D33C|nr:phosphate ABC transporter substrate-binding protein [Clostridium sp. BJN0001]
MKKKMLKICMSTLLTMSMGFAMAGCGSLNGGSNDSTSTKSEETSEEIAGSITVSGSSALLPLMEQAIEKFNAKYPDASISAQAGGSGTGLTQVMDGTVDIGNSDIFAEEKLDKDKASTLVDHQVVAESFAIAVNKSVGVDNLTKDQIKKIFLGEIKNWKEVGGKDQEIFVIHRKDGSGTRATFEKKLLDGTKENDAIGIMQDSNGAVLSAMKQNEGAISYLGLAYLNGDDAKNAGIVATKIDGVSAEKNSIADGSYKFWSWGHMYTKGEAKGLSKQFIDYISSSEVKEIVDNLGFVSISDMKVKE